MPGAGEGVRGRVQKPAVAHRAGRHRAAAGLRRDRPEVQQRGAAGAAHLAEAPAPRGAEAVGHRDHLAAARVRGHGPHRDVQRLAALPAVDADGREGCAVAAWRV